MSRVGLGMRRAFLGDGRVGRASELCCCLQALYVRNKWRLTTPPHQIRDTFQSSTLCKPWEGEVKTAWSTQVCVTVQDGEMVDIGLKGELEREAAEDLEGKKVKNK